MIHTSALSLFETNDYHVELKLKKIKHIYFKIHHHHKKIIISVPDQIEPDVLNQALLSKKQWILKQISDPGTSLRTDITGTLTPNQTLLFLGVQYPVKIIHHIGPPRLNFFDGNSIEIYGRTDFEKSKIEGVIDAWYRSQIKPLIKIYIDKWEPVLGVRVADFGVKKMKTRWGSCNIKAHRIWLNFHLIKLEHQYLEYVVVHEMTHLLERNHNHHFKTLMDTSIPQWRTLKESLNRYTLHH